MRAGGNQYRDVARRDTGHLLEQRLEHLAPRLRARDIAYGDREALAGAHELAKRRRPERRPDSLQQCFPGVRHLRLEMGFDDGDPLVRKVDVEAVSAVIQAYSHGVVRAADRPARTSVPL